MADIKRPFARLYRSERFLTYSMEKQQTGAKLKLNIAASDVSEYCSLIFNH